MNLMRAILRAAEASPHELRVRGRQIVFSRVNALCAERGRAIFRGDGHLRSLGIQADALTSWVRQRSSSWFGREDRRRRICHHFDAHPAAAAALLERADRILNDEMFILGHGPVPFRGDDRWRRDQISVMASPPEFYGRIRYLDCARVGDSKLVWEPNRFAWAWWLGAVHSITGKPSYSEKFSELTLDWFEKNPYPLGINYCSALEMGLRAYAWVWALELFRDAGVADDAFARLIQGIWTSCRHVENNLSYYFAPNTHLLGEGFALFGCGSLVPEFKESPRWRHVGAAILAQEATRQFHRDGTHRELSTCYHLYATDFYVQAVLIARQTGFGLPPAVAMAAQQAAARLGELVAADGILPPLNDCDSGRLDWFNVDPLDAAPTLQAARALWPDLPLPRVPDRGNGYHVWMAPATACEKPCEAATDGYARSAGQQGLSVSAGPSHMAVDAPRNQQRYDSGIVTYRNAEGDYALFRCGPFGYMDCGHSHDAQTSLILYLAGQPVIVDCGTGAYTRSRAIRDSFRGALSKNVLTLAGCEPSAADDWFHWQRKTEATLTEVRHTESSFQCAGFHDGFQPALGFSARVARSVEIDDCVALVVDTWNTANPVTARLAWTLDPGLQVLWESGGEVCGPIWRGTMRDGKGRHYHFLMCRLAADADVTIASRATSRDQTTVRDDNDSHASAPGEIGGCELSVSAGPYSPAYGVLHQTQRLVMDVSNASAGCVVTAFSKVGPLAISVQSTGQFVVTARPRATAGADRAAQQAVL
ncbi:MAG: alginate lyase family protein [Planctomycetia bacterium]|nr:alginate lyase family protein [Planctomycetia bacterium]